MNNMLNNKNNIVKYYNNPYENKKLIYSENKNKCGIYRWYNLMNHKTYIGSSIELRSRFYDYFSINNMKNGLLKYNSNIYKALIKYNYSQFRLDIIRYCNKEDVIELEQYYIDLFKPEYNILKEAYSLRGFKHSHETITKLKNYKRKPEHLLKLKLAKELIGQKLIVLDKNNGYIYKFPSLRSAAKFLNTKHQSLTHSMKVQSTFKNRYIIIKLFQINFIIDEITLKSTNR